MRYSDEYLDEHIARLMACNADDGDACAMSGLSDMKSAISAAMSEFQGRYPGGPDSEFLRLLRKACLGEADFPPAPERPATPPFATLSFDPVGVDTLSTVVNLATLLRLMSRRDKERLERDHSIRFTATGSTVGTEAKERAEERLVKRLAALPATARRFSLAPDQAHGRPYVWFTAREDLDLAFGVHGRHGDSRAKVARDYLGLIHHGPTARGSTGPNRLIALHFPAILAERAGYLRPSAVQAFDNRRFILRFGPTDLRSDADWGLAFDLHLFASSLRQPAGGRERVLLRLQETLLEGETLEFDYLGTVPDWRGELVGRDDDGAFLAYVKGDRDANSLVVRMCR